MPYKLKHRETGLYWKGSSQKPLEKGEMNKLCWSKNGKSWNQKGHLSSALTNVLRPEYIRGTSFEDYSKSEVLYGWFEENCVVEYYETPKEINFSDFKKLD